jgi:predicted acetyltransferase
VTQTYPIRAIEPAEFSAFLAVTEEAFNLRIPSEVFAELEGMIFEFDRSAAAFDGDQVVGTACTYTFSLSVPGGAVAAGGISDVAVLPTYRRRGIMSSLMRRQLADIAGRGEPLAALFASEPEIYGRFGFGCATEHLHLTIARADGRLIPPAADGDAAEPPRLRLADPEQIRAELAAVYEAVAARRPGFSARNERWWTLRLADPEWERDGMSTRRWLLAEDDAGPRGYACYAVRPQWGPDAVPAGELAGAELLATDPQAAAALWTDLLTRDLIGTVRTFSRPVDEELLQLLAGRRRAQARLTDGMWVRLIDVPAALAQRRYARDLDVVIEVTDTVLPDNAGRWRLQAGAEDKATCERTSEPPDVLVPVQALGAAYLGGARLGAMAAAGQVREARPGSLAVLSAAMSWDPAPWCPMGF